jgi:tripartite-type tricarboxylate transporter receptor subunit TctC
MARLWAGLLFVFACQAQAWPEKPVRIIVPFAPGGSADTLGRLVAQKLSEHLKASFVVENRGGAGGALGLRARGESRARRLHAGGLGHRLARDRAAAAAGHALRPGARFHPHRAVRRPAGGARGESVDGSERTCASSSRWQRRSRRAFSYGSPGNGTQGQLVAELFKQRAGIQMVHVPYKGAAGAVTDLMAGHIQVVSTTLTTAATQIRAGRARGLAVSAPRRLPDFPEIPTYAEMGYPDLVATVWFSLSGPAKMPGDVVGLLNAEVNRALELPEVRERLKLEGHRAEPAGRARVQRLRRRGAEALGAGGEGIRREERLSEFPRFSDAEYARRHQALGRVMQKHGVDHLLIVTDHRAGNAPQWVTGWPGTVEAYVVFQPRRANDDARRVVQPFSARAAHRAGRRRALGASIGASTRRSRSSSAAARSASA